MSANPQQDGITERAAILLQERKDSIYRDTSRLFAYLMLSQWIAGITAAVLVAPHTWAGVEQKVHLHVWAAIFLGAAIASLPVVLAFTRPTATSTRHVIAGAQMFWSALLIHLTGGRIETHFHVFGSLAFLAFFRDWRVFITATIVVGLDHLIRGVFYPQSVYGVLTASPWRSVEHAAWVLFENLFLVHSCKKASAEMRDIAQNRARLEATNRIIELEVQERTKQVLQLQEALQVAEVGISRLDQDGIYQAVDEVYANMIGYHPEELIGNGWEPTVHPEDRPLTCAAYQTMKNEGRGEVQVRAIRKDDSSFHKRVVMVSTHNEQNEFTGHYCFMTNVDREKKYQEELRIARDQALQAAHAKSDFLANMSHEIRTPMSGIIGMTELLLETELNEEQSDYASTVMSSADSLLCIINDILDFSKIEAGKLSLAPINFNFREMISDLERLLEVSVTKKKLTLITEIEQRVPQTVFGDPDRLKQILLNLLSNAIKFTKDKGGILLLVELDQETSNEVTLAFTVSDSGIGIEHDIQSRIFEAFTQADNTTTRKYGGTGLGLTISSQLVTLMDGQLSVNSEPGVGSAFRFTARLAKRSKTVENTTTKTLPRNEEPARSLSVLVVEDNQVNQRIVTAMLEKQGHTVRIAQNGKEALEVNSTDKFDVILMDIQMPIMGGEEAVAHIRAAEKERSLPHIPIIALTAHAMRGDREKYLAAGMDAYVAKPIDKDELLNAIARLVVKKPL